MNGNNKLWQRHTLWVFPLIAALVLIAGGINVAWGGNTDVWVTRPLSVTFYSVDGTIIVEFDEKEFRSMTAKELRGLETLIGLIFHLMAGPEYVEIWGKKLLPRYFKKLPNIAKPLP